MSAAAATCLVRDGYDAIADAYTAAAASVPSSHPRRQRVADLLQRLPAHSAVLELGCGGGLPVAGAIVEAGHSLVGLDLSPRQVALAKHNVPGGEFRVVDAASADFPPHSFSAVVALYMVSHIPRGRWNSVFAKLHRWLDVDGLLLINLPQGDSPGWLEENFLELGGQNWTNGYPPSVSLDLLRQNNFIVLEATTVPEPEPDGGAWTWVTAQAAPSLE